MVVPDGWPAPVVAGGVKTMSAIVSSPALGERPASTFDRWAGATESTAASTARRSMELITGMYKSAMTGQRVTFPIAADDPWYSRIPASAS